MEPFTLLIVAALLLFSALFSGLTLGILSLDIDMLRRKIKLGNNDAEKVYPLRKQGNLLLCTLILGNVTVNTMLAVFLGSVTTGIAATVIATVLIVIFGEIVPQAVFARHGLRLGARCAPLVSLMILLFFPIARPIAYFLDKTLGGGLPTKFSRKELRLFIKQQQERSSDIKQDEFELLHRGLAFSEKTVKDIMTPLSKIYYIGDTVQLNAATLAQIHARGHSRIPVVNAKKKQVVGILYTKDLIKIDLDDRRPVSTVMRKNAAIIHEHDRLDKVFKLFQEKRIHLFIVRNAHNKVSGIITLEDVLEELVGEIADEYDSQRMQQLQQRVK